MAKIQEAHSSSMQSNSPRQRVSSTRAQSVAPSQIVKCPQIPPTEGGVPTSPSSPPPQRRYEMRRAATTLGGTTHSPQSSMRRPSAKRAKTSALGESSKAQQLEPPVVAPARAPADIMLPSDMSSGSIIKCSMLLAPPIEGNSDYNSRLFHLESYFAHEDLRPLPELRDSYGLLQRYFLEQIMTLREFFYP